MGHGHGHGHGAQGHAAGRSSDRRRLKFALGLTSAVLVVQLIGSWLAGSLALLADAGHMATDSIALLVALAASYVAGIRPGPRSTFGFHRVEILAVVVNALVLFGVCGTIVYAAVGRLADPEPVDAGLLVVFAAVGMAANAVSLIVLQRSESGSLNLKAAATEVLADLIGSVCALAAGLLILAFGWLRADPLASLLIAALIVPRAIILLRDAAVVLLELAPRGLDLNEVQSALGEVEGVTEVHDLHAWTITSGLPCLSVHVTVTDAALAARGVGAVLDDLGRLVADRFGVRHATFQVEPASHRAHEDLGEVH
ncbi:cation diffusion facilitator family transporter [Nocardioides insulae]|uniref:cation diffusion facilitator family transporter n=1 Tax=Nocardioides insulae TaxID=394734 RepID=UPI00041674FF|nr:cation diffusion facilitator family transporter [Nocardioides insulae]